MGRVLPTHSALPPCSSERPGSCQWGSPASPQLPWTPAGLARNLFEYSGPSEKITESIFLREILLTFVILTISSVTAKTKATAIYLIVGFLSKLILSLPSTLNQILEEMDHKWLGLKVNLRYKMVQLTRRICPQNPLHYTLQFWNRCPAIYASTNFSLTLSTKRQDTLYVLFPLCPSFLKQAVNINLIKERTGSLACLLSFLQMEHLASKFL